MFFGENDPKKDNNLKCKVNTLVHYMSFGPNLQHLHTNSTTYLHTIFSITLH
jgi:hypothetical protein